MSNTIVNRSVKPLLTYTDNAMSTKASELDLEARALKRCDLDPRGGQADFINGQVHLQWYDEPNGLPAQLSRQLVCLGLLRPVTIEDGACSDDEQHPLCPDQGNLISADIHSAYF